MTSEGLYVPPAAVLSLSSSNININDTLGAAFIGLVFTTILFGVTNAQSLIYYRNSTRDPRSMRWTVAFLWLFNTLQLALISHILYVYLVSHFANVLAFDKLTWSLCLATIVAGISDSFVRLHYVWRVWTVSNRNWIPTAGSVTLGLLAFISLEGFGAKCLTFSSLTDIYKISWLLYIGFISGVVADLWIAVTLCFFLVRGGKDFGTADPKIEMMIIYVINTGLLIGIFAILTIVTYAAFPQRYIFIGLYFTLPKLYLNSLLAMLNARERLQAGQANVSHSIVMPGRDKLRFERSGFTVRVQTETNYHSDVNKAGKMSDGQSSILPL